MRRFVSLIVSLMFAASSAMAQASEDFWSETRRGTNSFNRVESEAHLAQARAFGADFVRMAIGKWEGSRRDYLAGDLDDYKGLEDRDVAHLRSVLDGAERAGVPIVLTPLDLPGARWRQNNANVADDRIWTDRAWWDAAARYWTDIAREFGGHPAIVGYNLLNEPVPELDQGIDETSATIEERNAWCEQVRGTPRDLDAFYRHIIAAIRTVDPDTPIILDGGWYAQPMGIRCLTAIDDPHVLYAMHMYEPYGYTTWRWNQGRLTYPGQLFYGGQEESWDAARIAAHLQPMLDWSDSEGLSRDRILLGEFGCDRRVPGCAAYLGDVISSAEAAGIHWAFYAFREDVWDAMDYELGDGPTPNGFYSEGGNGDVPRAANPMSETLRRALSPSP